MSNDFAIKAQGLTKIFKLYDKPVDRLKEAISPFGRKYNKDFYALKDLNFEIKKGESIGIIGKNGSGKSTLLKIITGVLTPSSGDIKVNGRIAALLELGAGFNPELTGVENIFLNGTLMGISEEEMKTKLDDIISFADIGDFIHQQVKMYSSGMFARLAFAVAINVDADILIVDEALSVGDMRFQQKCIRKMKSFQESGKTVLFVSHDTGVIQNFCTRAIWLDEGLIKEEGDTEKVIKNYVYKLFYNQKSVQVENVNIQNQGEDYKWVSLEGFEHFGSQEVKMTSYRVFNQLTHEKINIFNGGENVVIEVKAKFNTPKSNIGIGILFKDKLGNAIFSLNNYIYDINFGEVSSGEKCFSITFQFPYILNGKYSGTIGIAEGNQLEHKQIDWVHDAIILTVENPKLRYQLGSYIILENNVDIKIS